MHASSAEHTSKTTTSYIAGSSHLRHKALQYDALKGYSVSHTKSKSPKEDKDVANTDSSLLCQRWLSTSSFKPHDNCCSYASKPDPGRASTGSFQGLVQQMAILQGDKWTCTCIGLHVNCACRPLDHTMSSGGCCVLCEDAKFGVQGSVLEWCHNKEFRACWMQTGVESSSQSSL